MYRLKNHAPGRGRSERSRVGDGFGGRWFKGAALQGKLNDAVDEIASFMCRSRREIREKTADLERSGELPGLIEKAAAEAVDEPGDDNDTQGETATYGTATPPMMLVG